MMASLKRDHDSNFTLSLLYHCVVVLCCTATLGVLAQRPVCQCVPPKFTITEKAVVIQVSDHSKTPTIVKENMRYAFDSMSETSAVLINITSFDGTLTNRYQVITDHTKKTRWTVDLDSTTCDRTRYTTKLKRCVPNESNYTDTFYIGSKELFGDEWTFFSPDPYAVGISSLALLEDSCIPLRTTFYGEIDSALVTLSATFEDYEDGIADPDKFFRLPPYCPMKVTTGEKKVKTRPMHSSLSYL